MALIRSIFNRLASRVLGLQSPSKTMAQAVGSGWREGWTIANQPDVEGPNVDEVMRNTALLVHDIRMNPAASFLIEKQEEQSDGRDD